ncbi:glycosyltransferase family 4 protein [Vibrio sp. 10N.261.46.E12]|uniref:glycosyltransferase family 4 protein n=1 Tax=unclassified Vibrio TaxID=2614977 RepID=UPI000975DD7D|nr:MULTISPECIES: glycosyltransferase family 4 protein [unclassified Vibrio]OMO37335.1 glycosyl transferase family 1 [Vibrio sp. 10N.261.45.E1]PMJ21962.1 glycosyl transferase family 1 [Vibrio sp. 10N.286.45.B6]PML90602.1 glycosyl transferase family 1 [Vibrio sp. 10N.261.49.E11]PMM72085.1 glycosyl transferase family 1 [Vibrio sp. 10N.261.46.F12]PMM80644.1 glycosyl transferase family 1 [Vibrio sp. 10N.261.46.E8]
MSTIKPNDGAVNVNLHEIWLLIDSQTFGGIETHVLELAQGLISESAQYSEAVRIVLLTKFNPEAIIVERLNTLNIPFSYLSDLASSCSSDSSGNSAAQLKRAVQHYQPRLIHAHGYKASLVSKLIKLPPRLVNTKQITTYHAGETPTGKVWLYDWLDRYSSFLSDQSLVVSEKIKAKVPSKTHQLNNFVKVPSGFKNSPSSSPFHVGFVGRLSHEKAPDRFIALAKQFPEVQFELFGDGPEMPVLVKSQPDNVTFHGHQTNMDRVWSQIDLLVIPSRFEGLPMAALEAMIRGIPVLATSVGNLPQLIEHQVNGYLANSEAELEQFLSLWMSLTNEQRDSLKSNSIETVKNQYSPQAVVPQLLEIYQLDHYNES